MICRIFILLFLAASTGVYIGCVTTEPVQQEVLVVKIPPFYDSHLTPGQNHWVWSEFLFPQGMSERLDNNGTIPDFGVPNDDSLITVRLSDDGKLSINSESYGDILNTETVKGKLKEVFEERAENGVFEPGSQKVVKAVGIRLPHAARYGDLLKITRALKESGADPIVLLLDGHLPQQVICSIPNAR